MAKRRKPSLPRVPIPRPQQVHKVLKNRPHRKRKHKGKEE